MELKSNIIGVCRNMCPESEIKMRERGKLLHRLEMLEGTEKHKLPKADPTKMVKCFTRSAAGQNMQSPSILRPTNVLLDTIDYLLDRVIQNTQHPPTMIFDFIWDRLRAIRQDMVIQTLGNGPSISLLQPIVRFHAYFAYKLCEEPIANFDPTMNNKHLQECMKKLLNIYDDCEYFKHKCNSLGLKMKNYDMIYIDTRPAIEAIYILHNLGDSAAINRGLQLTDRWRTYNVNLALSISINYVKGNWVRVCKNMTKLPSLLAAVASLHLPEIRRKTLCVMSSAYNSKNLWYPICNLKEALLYSNNADLLSDLKYYNVSYDKDKEHVQFLKANFNNSQKSLVPRHEEFVETKLIEKSIPTIVLHGEI